MFFFFLILGIAIAVGVLALSIPQPEQSILLTMEQKPAPEEIPKKTEIDDLEDLTDEEISSAVLKHTNYLSDFTYTESAAHHRLNEIAEYRKRVDAMPASRVRRAYYKWLDFAEERTEQTLKDIAKRKRTEVNARRIPKP